MRYFPHVVGLAVSLTMASGAFGQTLLPSPVAAAPDARTKAQAKNAFMQAKQYFKAGKFEKAAELYTKADGLVPAPTPKFYIAQSWDKAGKVPEAIAAYEAFIEAASNDKERYGDKLAEADERLKVLVPQTQAQIAVVLDPPVEGASIQVDGAPVEGTTASLAPGKYTLIISAPGYQTQAKDVEVVGAEGTAGDGVYVIGAEGTLTVSLVAEEVAPPPGPDPLTTGDGASDGDGDGSGLLVPGIIVGGVGLAGLAVGAAFGSMALGSASDFEETPTEELADDAESQALIADIGLIVGGIAVAAGVTMIIIDMAGGDSTEEQAVTVVPMLGPDTQGVSTVVRF